MKSIYSLLFFAFTLLMGSQVNAQSASEVESYFLGKWNVTVKGTPNGDITIPFRFAKVDGKLKGYFLEPEAKDEKATDTVYIEGAEIKTGFNIAGYDVVVGMSKKDDDNATGSLMGMFDVTAARVKESAAAGTNGGAASLQDYFLGKWDVTAKGTPNGDVTIPSRFAVVNGALMGYFVEPGSSDEKAMSSVKLEGEKLIVGFTVMSYDITVWLTKKDNDTATGSLMDMFEVVAVRKK